ncbi:MAG: cytochrome c peroxidase [bacterium]
MKSSQNMASCGPHALIIVLILGIFGGACDPAQDVRKLAGAAGAHALEPLPSPDAARVELGRMLFFDPILSGNRDISCATCHHPRFATADGLPLPIGTGGEGLGPERTMRRAKTRVARNSPDLFNRAHPRVHTMFWDNRIEAGPDGQIVSPAGGLLPAHARTMSAAQALFPLIARTEMRGEQRDVNNEIGALLDSQNIQIWAAVLARVTAIDGYKTLLAQAYPDVPFEQLSAEHLANALADFQAASFDLVDSPWDAFMRGDAALTPSALRGAKLFFGDAGCATCHNGPLLSDQTPHNIGVPVFGPGKEPFKPLDVGHQAVTGNPLDAFKFRTPPLRNVALTGPYMHNGAFATLPQTIQHHLDPAASWDTWTPEHLADDLSGSVRRDPDTRKRVWATLELASPKTTLTTNDVQDLVAFLNALTSPSAKRLESVIPSAVPSGLPVQR